MKEDLEICDTCQGFIPPFPENKPVLGIAQCHCQEERHIAEQAMKAQGGGSGLDPISVNASESVKVKTKGPGER